MTLIASEARCVVALVSRAVTPLQCFVVDVVPTRAECLIPSTIITCALF